MESDQIYVFETRCRKCGNTSQRYFAHVQHMDVFTFTQAMQECIDRPKVYECKPCGKDTIGDVVCFGKK